MVDMRYDKPLEMLQALHEGVKELGTGAVALPHESPNTNPPSFGFVLYSGDSNEEARRWNFYIPLAILKETFHEIPDNLWDLMKTTRGRVELAALLRDGMTPGHIEAWLSDSIVQYIRRRAARYEEQGQAERAAMTRTTEAAGPDKSLILANVRFNGNGFSMMPGDSANHKAMTLRELARDLALGRHLTG